MKNKKLSNNNSVNYRIFLFLILFYYNNNFSQAFVNKYDCYTQNINRDLLKLVYTSIVSRMNKISYANDYLNIYNSYSSNNNWLSILDQSIGVSNNEENILTV